MIPALSAIPPEILIEIFIGASNAPATLTSILLTCKCWNRVCAKYIRRLIFNRARNMLPRMKICTKYKIFARVFYKEMGSELFPYAIVVNGCYYVNIYMYNDIGKHYDCWYSLVDVGESLLARFGKSTFQPVHARMIISLDLCVKFDEVDRMLEFKI